MAAISQTPNNTSQLLAAIEKIRTDIQTESLPADRTANKYVDERVIEAIKEAVQRVRAFQARPIRQFLRVFFKAP